MLAGRRMPPLVRPRTLPLSRRVGESWAMSPRPIIVVTAHLAEAGVERPILEEVAEIRLLMTSDENDVARRGADAGGLMTGAESGGAGRGADADVRLVCHDIKLTERGLAALPRVKAVIRC